MTLDLYEHIRSVPDFPRKGILFRDITTLLKDPAALRAAADSLAEPFRSQNCRYVVGIESRGFIFGAIMAEQLGAGFVPVRKPGKLPAATHRRSYTLEYGSDAVEIHADAVKPGDPVVVHDDLLATGGTAMATVELLRELGAEIVGVSFLIELTFLQGRNKLAGYPVYSVLQYGAE